MPDGVTGQNVVRLTGLTRSFVQGGETIAVLRGVNLAIAPGEIVGLLGPSGSGKSTLLQAVGFVYQCHHLLPDFSAAENVVLPQLVAGVARGVADGRARELLTQLGLGARLTHRPSQLSGGEQQRVAVARALANRPCLVLADEPTGNLDEATAEKVLEAFLALVRGTGSAALIATHNERLAARLDRVVRLHEGVLA